MPAALRGGAPLSDATAPLEVDTPSGTARLHFSGRNRNGLLVLGHGAGGGIQAPDLIAVTEAAVAAGWAVARVEQPYRVLGRRAPAPASRLDAAWVAAVAAARRRRRGGALVCGGRSSGARVACRTAAQVGADAVVALAFPLHPPRRPERSRAGELTGAGVPTLVVQGERDPFGGPRDLPAGPEVVAVAGDHSLRQERERVAAAVVQFLEVVAAGIDS